MHRPSPITMTRRTLLGLGAGALAGVALGGLAGCGPARPLRVAISPWAGYQFILLARQEGWLPPEDRLQLLETPTLDASARLLAEGAVDAAALTLDEVLGLRARGLDLTVALVFNVSAGGDALLARPGAGINTLADLAGKRLAVESSSLGAIMLHEVLQIAGLAGDALTVVPMDTEHVAAWEHNAPEAILTYEPALSQLEARGLTRLFDSRDMPQIIFDELAIRTAALTPHGGALRDLIAGHFRALAQWFANPIDTTHRLSPRLGVAPDLVRRILGGLDLPDALYNRHYLTPPAPILAHAAGEIARIMAAAGLPADAREPQRLFNPAWLPEEHS